MFAGGTSLGFYNAPVSKALIIITGAASAVNIFLPIVKIQSNAELFHYFQNSNILRGLFRPFYFSNLKNLFFGSLLLYSFRIFEHRYGSTKFANYLLASTIIGAGLQYTVLHVLPNQDINIGNVPTGPFEIIFSLFVPFFLSVPSVDSSMFGGLVPGTGKLLTYIVGLQMFLVSRGGLFSGISGLAAGVMYRLNILYVQSWLKLPDTVSHLCSRIFGVFFHSSAPAHEGKIHGATLEVQRQQRMDQLDQQMWRLQEINRTRRRPVIVDNPANAGRAHGQGYPDVLIDDHNMAAVADDQEDIQHPAAEVSEDQVQILIEMGFTRQAALQALAASNNNLAVAMNILLS